MLIILEDIVESKILILIRAVKRVFRFVSIFKIV